MDVRRGLFLRNSSPFGHQIRWRTDDDPSQSLPGPAPVIADLRYKQAKIHLEIKGRDLSNAHL
jgi:hypothetical protein